MPLISFTLNAPNVKTEKDMNSNDMFKSAEEENKKPEHRVISGKEYRTFKKENRSIRYF